MIYFEDARLEFLGFPMFYWPYLSAPDPTVKRKTGFLHAEVRLLDHATASPSQTPYFWALAPDYDFTLTPTLISQQGLLMQAEWRQRLMNGSYSIRAAGIFQADPGAFATRTPAVRQRPGRPAVPRQHRHHRPVRLNNNWVWGWDGTLVTDKCVLQDYGLRTYFAIMDPFKSGGLETVIAALSVRPRRAQLFRCARDVLLRSLGERRAEPASDRASGARLQEQARPAAVRRRADLLAPISPACRATAPTSIRSRRPAFNNGQCDRLTADPARQDADRTACCAAFPAPIRAPRPRPPGGAP